MISLAGPAGAGILAGAVLPLFLGYTPVDHPTVELIARMSSVSNTLDGILDGTMGADGYADTKTQSTLTLHVKTYRGTAASGAIEEQIQLFLSVVDNSNDTLDQSVLNDEADTLRLFLDLNHDHMETAEDRSIVIVRKQANANCPVCVKVGPLDLSGAANLSQAQWRIVNSPGEWSVEIQIKASDLGQNVVPSLLGLKVRVRNTDALVGFDFPAAAVGSWANLSSRNPVDFAVSLDNSGSMLALDGGGETRWERAKRATDLFAAALGVFKDPSFNDRIAISQYSWTCGAPQSSGDQTGAVQGLSNPLTFQPIPATPNDPGPTFTSPNTVGPASNNCTPIQRGLDYAIRQQGGFDATTQLGRDRIVLLLSDGLHNTPSGTFDFGLYTSTEKTLVQVQTVAIGPDGIVDNQRLDDIANAFRGDAAVGARFNNAQSFADLLRAYIEAVEDPLTINTIDPDGAGAYQPGPVDKLAFFGVWNTKTQAQALTITRGGTTQTPNAAFVSTKTGYAVAVFNNPAVGTWTMTGPTAAQGQRFVLADLRVLARFEVEQRGYAAGEPILLIANLKDRGQPILGAEVTVEAEGPAQGLGTYLSTIQEDCSFARPRPPDSLPPRRDSTGTVRDSLPLRYRLAAAAFARCKTDGLGRDSLPGQPLYDDATHGDLVGGDGVYALAFDATGLEGTRNFVFHVRGRTTDGIDFTRTRRLSRFIRIHPDPLATQELIRFGPVQNGQQLVSILFLPLDSVRRFKGPGFAESFRVRAVGAQLVGPVTDLENGYYLQTIRYPVSGLEPRVTIELPGTPFQKVVDLHPTSEIWKWLLRWLCPILVLLLLLLLALRWRRRKPA